MDANLVESSPEQQLLEFFKALAEPKRLKLIGILASSSYSVEELAAMLNLRESTVSHHLSYLAHVGLVSARAEGYYSVYQLETKALQEMAGRLLAKETLPSIVEDVDLDAYDVQVLRKFSRADGSLKSLPAQEKKFQAVLRYAAKLFDEKKRYNEKDVNRILKRLHADTASLRRGFIEYKLMKRENGVYWRI
ncbi:MAG TPA: metalloregulator ArsR/SmtB family transcription factor [Terriglobales bacterium]|nr:metalloregulator ArsR/SmtB family transcription factor [Terriglobales bacterium]